MIKNINCKFSWCEKNKWKICAIFHPFVFLPDVLLPLNCVDCDLSLSIWSWSWCNFSISINHVLHVVLVLREIIWCVLMCSTLAIHKGCRIKMLSIKFLWHICAEVWFPMSHEIKKSKNTTTSEIRDQDTSDSWRQNELLFLERWSCTDCVNQQWQQEHIPCFFFSKKMSWLTFTVEMNQSFPAGTVNSFRTHVDLCHDIGWCLSHQAMTLIWEFSKSSNKKKKKRVPFWMFLVSCTSFFSFFFCVCLFWLTTQLSEVSQKLPTTGNA